MMSLTSYICPGADPKVAITVRRNARAQLALVPRPRIRARTASWPPFLPLLPHQVLGAPRKIPLTRTGRRTPPRVGGNGGGSSSHGIISSWVGSYLGSIQKELVGRAARVGRIDTKGS